MSRPSASASAPAAESVPYDPKTTKLLTFHDAVPAFLSGADTPRAYLERCLETIAAREPEVKAFVHTNVEGARKAADASSARYKAGKPLSPVDGMPMGIKDLYETADMPTELNSPIYKGWQPIRDSAHVYALRRGGAAILAKTVTTEFGSDRPGPTRNPFDTSRTPGGSSSGTSAAIGARMLPAATGSQVRGSIIRPAGYCGNYAIKPTFGAINRGGGHGLAPSQSVLGVHAGSLEDMWRTAFYISSTAGGDAGQPGLYGQLDMPAASKPKRIIRLDTLGWKTAEPEAKEVLAAVTRTLAAAGVEIISRADDPRVEALEASLARIPEFMFAILGYEARWPVANYIDMGPELLGPAILERFGRSQNMTPDDYRKALAMRAELRAQYAQMAEIGDAMITLSAGGVAPVGMGVGDPVFADVTSCTGTCSIALPLGAVDNLPVGVQLMGFAHKDYELVGLARSVVEIVLGR